MKETSVEISKKERFSLKLQRIVGLATIPIWGSLFVLVMRFGAKYKIDKIREIRKQYRELLNESKGPVLVCANHLTMVDSAIINWSLASTWSYMKSFRLLPWNMPERANYWGSYVLRFICYLGSCIPVDRGGDRDRVRKSLDKVTYLLKKGHLITIFPEGRRSRNGRIDSADYSYGPGRLVKAAEGCRVLCIYLRGEGQNIFSKVPKRGEKFYLDMALIKPETNHSGLRATRDLAQQIILQLSQMEQMYFAACRQ